MLGELEYLVLVGFARGEECDDRHVALETDVKVELGLTHDTVEKHRRRSRI